MCNESKSCLCHRIKDFIITDKKEKFLGFFQQRHIIELYSFLKESYPLVNPKFKDENFNEVLQRLVNTYIDPPGNGDHSLVINVNHEVVKKRFLSTYHKYQNQQRDKTRVLVRLTQLIHDVENLAYNNLDDNQDFKSLLQKGAKKLTRSFSSKVASFLHPKKTPASSGPEHENNAESSSPPSPSN
ncbi:hypothetical protein J2N86_00065 [Legionella lytica]|uniref:RGS domain-containing protein n=1 Tax=Legionella lytica TaxID=96232 RepID=A0ABY4Y846_9GAMM|nr:hypothetical protein [Legionella lytica]USQ13782.1 hypothetical protein J2N86_00065 [Legionella lytica]